MNALRNILALLALNAIQETEAQSTIDRPHTKTFSFEYTWNPTDSTTSTTNTDIAFTTDLNFDIGAGYELPVYTQQQYYITRQRVAFFFGGRQELIFQFYVIRLNLLFDLYPFEWIFENYLSFDLLDSGAVCNARSQSFDALRLQTYVQLDVADCGLGLIGYLTRDQNVNIPYACDWRNYYVNKPVLEWHAFEDQSNFEWTYTSAGCGNQELPRYSA